jgi:hypothetical protein
MLLPTLWGLDAVAYNTATCHVGIASTPAIASLTIIEGIISALSQANVGA